ncbi:MAG: hypothetical protein ABI595_06375 [Actinomycetota bacterium]
MDIAEQEWTSRYLAPLVGATITEVGITDDEDIDLPNLHVRLTTGEECVLEISRDEEGNGPGFIFGLAYPGFMSNCGECGAPALVTPEMETDERFIYRVTCQACGAGAYVVGIGAVPA